MLTLFLTLNKAIKATNCKVSALENVVKPRLENTMRFIKWELHELEREDFLKLIRVTRSGSSKGKCRVPIIFLTSRIWRIFILQKGISMGDVGNLFSMETKNGEDIIF